MAVFVGTIKEFRRYIGPRLRNLVQQQTKAYKVKTATCQHCGSANALESAHVKGQDRNQIIDQTLVGHYSENVVTVRLDLFEEKFKEAHEPIEKSILILCRSCHAKYDSTATASMQQTPVSITDNIYQDYFCDSHVLPITLEPSNSDAFKSELLISRRAEIQIHYADGRIKCQPWNASKFKMTSNVYGNLRSRPEFRSGAWQINKIE